MIELIIGICVGTIVTILLIGVYQKDRNYKERTQIEMDAYCWKLEVERRKALRNNDLKKQ